MPPPANPGPPRIAHELIGTADRLADLTRSAHADPQQADLVLRWFGKRTEILLATCGIERVEEDGPVDPQRHEVVATRVAPGAELVDRIAQTVRPGYAWNGSLLRPQQVIAYVSAEDAAAS